MVIKWMISLQFRIYCCISGVIKIGSTTAESFVIAGNIHDTS